MNRRRFLLAAGTAGLGLAGLAAWRYWPEHGLMNPCLAALPREVADHELVRAAWEGLDPTQVWDCHAHLVGTGDAGSGIWLNPALESMVSPIQYAQRLFFLNAGCAHDAPGRVDQSYIERMHNLIDGLRPGDAGLARLLLVAAHPELGCGRMVLVEPVAQIGRRGEEPDVARLELRHQRITVRSTPRSP